ncbi:zinc-binding dehydrogenase [Microbacterium horticulturae]|uniref:Zinc-binding dehydrogenase n=1 Tax=Microbacterium horticulturae TaxID=3028316 RepID=A0ABY8C0F9_9MICO|nr:zinc-binding dehydrogenase [Microbacterium sp. KACC 23027]WEG09889.1 zinc-binding dehydrogenase [Microbacterium sp. KACC 23027]
MRAVTLHGGELAVDEVPAPQPGNGQLLLEVQRCGICGSDLHARHSQDALAEVLELCGYDRYMRSSDAVVMGHEIYGLVAGYGPGTRRSLPLGTPVVTVPLLRRGRDVDGIGLSPHAPGGFAEQVVVQETLTMPVPEHLAPDLAAMTEPMAVAWHAVSRGDVSKKDVTVVFGCGPVGLAVITVLKARGVRTVIAADLSAGRRALAQQCGADVVVDPSSDSVWDLAPASGLVRSMETEYNAGVEAIDGMRRLPVPWWQTWRALNAVGVTSPKRPVIFECVGIPGMIDGVLAQAPLHSRIVVVGVCMGPDAVRPSLAINKEVDLRFVVGYTPLEFRDTLHALADGTLDASPIVTGRVGLEGVARAFDALGDPEAHAKLMIDPGIPDDAIWPVGRR